MREPHSGVGALACPSRRYCSAAIQRTKTRWRRGRRRCVPG